MSYLKPASSLEFSLMHWLFLMSTDGSALRVRFTVNEEGESRVDALSLRIANVEHVIRLDTYEESSVILRSVWQMVDAVVADDPDNVKVFAEF